MNDKFLREQLQHKWDYPEYMLDSTILALKKMGTDLQEAFENWMGSGTPPTISVGKYNFQVLTGTFHLEPVAAFTTLDWLRRDYKSAEYTLRHQR